jgi:ribosomal protein L30/L7E
MFHVEITNFQSIKSMTLDFEGFTTIVGRNFIGKSATLRAINAALTNQQGTDFIRWGEKFCEVLIKTDNIKILWHKENSNNFYVINDGDPYEKVGNQPPPKPIIDAGFGLLNAGKDKVNLFYAQQFFPLFLIDKLDTKSADILISIYGLDKLYKAIDICSKDQRDNTSLLKLRKTDYEQAERDLERFQDFDKIKEATKNLEDSKVSLNKKSGDIDKLKCWLDLSEICTKDIKRFNPLKSLTIPSYASIEAKLIEYKKVTGLLQKVTDCKVEFLRLKEIKSVVISEDSSEAIDKKIKEVETIVALSNKHDTLTKQVKNLKKIKDISIPDIAIASIEEIKTLKDTYSKTVTIVTDVKKLRADIVEVTKEYDKVTLELSAYNQCPVCGADIQKL